MADGFLICHASMADMLLYLVEHFIPHPAAQRRHQDLPELFAPVHPTPRIGDYNAHPAPCGGLLRPCAVLIDRTEQHDDRERAQPAHCFRKPRLTHPASLPALPGPETIHRSPAQIHQIAPEAAKSCQEIAAPKPGKGLLECGRKRPVEPRIPSIEKRPRCRRGLPYEEDANPFRPI